MKVILFIASLLLLVSCNHQEPVKKHYIREGQLFDPAYTICKVEFEGHTYLLLEGYRIGGICHDENCKCKD